MFAHVPIAIAVQCITWWIAARLGARARPSIWAGWFAGSAVCVMREITQREYQWIEAFGQGRRINMPWYAGMKVWEWNSHSIEETIAAIVAATFLAMLVSKLSRYR